MTTTAPLARSPSPPPPGAPPTSHLTPGPRATALHSVFTSALTHTIQTCSYANFAACFPTPAKHARPILESVWRQVVGMIEEKSRREYEEILVERDVVAGLNELERLVAEAQSRREKAAREGEGMGEGKAGGEAWHTLPPRQLYLAHLGPYLADTQGRLEEELGMLRRENEELVRGVEGQREKVERLVGGLEGVIKDLEGANGVMGEVVEGGEVRREAMGVDAEMGGTRSRL